MKVQLELFQSENAILQFTFSRLLYLVRSSWTSSASISITDDSPVLSRPPLVSAVSGGFFDGGLFVAIPPPGPALEGSLVVVAAATDM